MQRILLLSGMTPDGRIFDRILPLLPNATIVDWIRPFPHESILSYAGRLSCNITKEPSIVCGVSFGGIVARELAAILRAKACVLISSVRTPHEMPPWFRLCGLIGPSFAEQAMKATGTIAATWPSHVSSLVTLRLRKFVGSSGAWYRWATSAVLKWKPSEDAQHLRVIQIHGDRDTTFPIRYVKPDVVIQGGGHVLPITHYTQIAAALLAVSKIEASLT